MSWHSRIVRYSTAGLVLVLLYSCAVRPLPVEPATPFVALERAPAPPFKHGSVPAESGFVPRYSMSGSDGNVVLEAPPGMPPPPPVGTLSQGLAVGCDPLHYLLDRANSADTTGVDNRFSWWDKIPPASGAMRPPPVGPIAARNTLICQFHPALARVTGRSEFNLVNAGFKFMSWENAAITSPNAFPEAEFIVRTHRPHSIPTVRDMPAAGGGGTKRVLVNDSAPGYQLNLGEGRFRPSLWIDFAVPQRAVAIEFGIPIDAGTDINNAGVKLIGYDRNGGIIQIAGNDGAQGLISDGRVYNGTDNIAPGDFEHVIGIQDRDGRISTVEMRFDYNHADLLDRGEDPGVKITVPQIVSRIWHEPLPAAAVLQDFVGLTTFAPPANPSSNVIVPPTFEEKFGKAPGPVTKSLPFRFDRAIVMIRGVRWQFTNPLPRPITELSVGISPTGIVQLPRHEQFIATTGTALNTRNLTITPSGFITAEAGSNHPFHLVVDYSLLGWNSEQVELFGTLGSAGSGPARDDEAITRINVGDPCPFSSTSISVEQRRTVCGPLLGVPHFIVTRYAPEQEFDRLDLVVASETGLGSRQGVSLRRADQGNQPIAVWEQGLQFEGDDDDAHQLSYVGTVLSGPSLRIGPDPLVPAGQPAPNAVKHTYSGPPYIPRADTGPRDDRSIFGFQPGTYRNFGIAWPVVADVAFVALEMIHTEPSGPLQQLDLEVKGDSYQGTVVDWKTGLGINTEPPIIGGLGASRDRFIAATALFGGVDDVQPFSTGFASKADLYFESGVTGLTQRAVEQPGHLHNTGRDALWIEEIRKGTQPADAYFNYFFHLPRHPMETGGLPSLGYVRLTEQQMRDRLPLMLRPGQRLEIHGHYSPVAATSFVPDMGSVEFRLRSGLTQSTRVFAFGSAIAASPGGEWRPTQVVFPAVSILDQPPAQLTALLVTTGSTPLAVRRMYFEDETLGYRFEMAPQIEPEAMGVRIICGQFRLPCRGQTRLIADTNAGLIPLTVRKEVLRRSRGTAGGG